MAEPPGISETKLRTADLARYDTGAADEGALRDTNRWHPERKPSDSRAQGYATVVMAHAQTLLPVDGSEH